MTRYFNDEEEEEEENEDHVFVRRRKQEEDLDNTTLAQKMKTMEEEEEEKEEELSNHEIRDSDFDVSSSEKGEEEGEGDNESIYEEEEEEVFEEEEGDSDNGEEDDEEESGSDIDDFSLEKIARDYESDDDSDDDLPLTKLKSKLKSKSKSKAKAKGKAGRVMQALSQSLIEEANDNRLKSLAPYRNALKPFINEKVFTKLTHSVNHDKLKHDNIKNAIQQPRDLKNCVMRSYQLEGLSWLVSNYDNSINCILGDEMGLGKTLQTISFITYLIRVRKVKGPFLVVIPLTVLFNWSNELRRFCPSLQVLRVHASENNEALRLRTILSTQCNELEVVLTTYEMLKSQILSKALKRIVWRTVILDEGHRIRNSESDVSKACFSIKAIFKIVLTGTPLQNNLRETGVILSFLAPNIFTDLSRFENAFDLNGRRKGSVTSVSIDRKLLDKAHYMMRPFILRRLKAEVEQKLPPKLETLVECPMSSLQKEISQFLLLKEKKVLSAMEKRFQGVISEQSGSALESAPQSRELRRLMSSANEKKSLLGLLAHLRKAANHPFLFPGIETLNIDGSATAEIISASGKMIVLDKLLTKLIEKEHRVVIFSQFTHTLDIICDYLDMKGYQYKRLDGSTNRVMREVNVTMFNRAKSEIPIFCLSTRAGGEGVNLYTADTVILFDSDWNPQADIQAMARVHRIGQTKPVHVYRLVTKGSVDECIVHRAQKKLFLDSMVNRGSTSSALALDELRGAAKNENEDDNIIESGRKRKRESGDNDDLVDEAEGNVDVEEDLTNPSELEQSQIFAALKFGWNSAFSMQDDNKGADENVITDEHIDAIIDRSRGFGPSSNSEISGTAGENDDTPANATRTICLNENQEMSIATFDETKPLISIDNLRHTIPTEEDAAVPSEEPLADDMKDVIEPVEKRPKRQIRNRMVEINVDGVGIVQTLRPEVLKTPTTNVPQKERNILEGFRRKGALLNSNKNAVFIHTQQSNGKQVAGRDFDHQDHCQACWDGGDIILCDNCPLSFHMSCLRLKRLPAGKWSCPHHKCTSCCRTSSAAALLFRCEVCPLAYCEDCLPAEASIIGESKFFKAKRYVLPSTACYIRCSQECIEFDIEGALAGDELPLDEEKEETKDVEEEEVKDESDAKESKKNILNLSEHHPLRFCKLEDIQLRLNRDEQRIRSRFKNLAEIPNFDIRFKNAQEIARGELFRLIYHLKKANDTAMKQLQEGESQPKEVVESGNTANPGEAMDADLSRQALTAEEAAKIIFAHAGIHEKLPSETKVTIFLDALHTMRHVSNRTVQQMATMLGICSATLIRAGVKDLLEPKFCFTPNRNRQIMEEAIVALLTILSPLNLILPCMASNKQLEDSLNARISGLFFISRLMQTLGESVTDDNRNYYVAMAVKQMRDERLATLNAWHVVYPRGSPANVETKLSWLFPAIRMFFTMTQKDVDLDPRSELYRELERAFRFEKGIYKPKPKQLPKPKIPELPSSKQSESQPPEPSSGNVHSAVAESTQDQLVSENVSASSNNKEKKSSKRDSQEQQISTLYLTATEKESLRRFVEQKVMAQYNVQHETAYMMNWLVHQKNALQVYEFVRDGSQQIDPSKLSPPGSWRASISNEQRSAVIQQLHQLFAKYGIQTASKSTHDYQNKLRIFEIALLTLAPSAKEYLAPNFVAKYAPDVVNQFEIFVKEELKQIVDSLMIEETKKLEAMKKRTLEELKGELNKGVREALSNRPAPAAEDCTTMPSEPAAASAVVKPSEQTSHEVLREQVPSENAMVVD